jgi:predicted transcriptional regulator
MQNRQKDEMTRDILMVSNGGATISQIMFRAYTSHSQARSYLVELIERGLMEYNMLDRKYHTTVKGFEYLQAIERISEVLSINTRRSKVSSKYEEAYQL